MRAFSHRVVYVPRHIVELVYIRACSLTFYANESPISNGKMHIHGKKHIVAFWANLRNTHGATGVENWPAEYVARGSEVVNGGDFLV